MDSVSELLKEISGNTFEVGSCLLVDVLHVNNPHSFYVRPRSYSKYLEQLQSKGENIAASEINVDDIFVFYSIKLQCAVRGKIAMSDTTGGNLTYKLLAIDNGHTEEGVPLNKIWSSPYYCQQVPPLATYCQLAYCAPRGPTWDQQAIGAMRTFVEGDGAKIIIRNKNCDKLIVELSNNSFPEDIATMLALNSYTTFGASVNNHANRPEPNKQYYVAKYLQVGEIIHVRMQYGNVLGRFFVIAKEDYPQYLSDRNNYTEFARLQSNMFTEELQLNAPVGVLYCKNYKYERGFIKELLPGNKAKMQLVDWGAEVEEPVPSFKAVPDWYLRVPMRALPCTLHSSQSFSSFRDLTAHLCPGMEFKITIKEVRDKDMSPNVVTISSLE